MTDTGTEQLFGIGLFGVLALIGLGALLLFLTALFSILGSNQDCLPKLLWLALAFAAPFLGPLLWFTVGKRATQYPPPPHS
ncbi:putative flippase GtrA [Crossiella equi]|uniref:Flippase GtrA n=1 Tax=Crossiella equi TaxID=130796 RepID=A0ABS5A7W0_9PSEU|nr:PLDc N-terminal domain-containing protein [Crossiella equi]MBP2472337.1 putative flippase GtrA [Crossiella equi]